MSELELEVINTAKGQYQRLFRFSKHLNQLAYVAYDTI